MRAIRTLCEEHQALREVLCALERILDCQLEHDRLEADLALDVLQWLERCIDGLHQDREELGLFPRLVERASDPAREVLGELMRWHEEERRRLGEMRERIEGAAYGDGFCRDAFTVAARAYIEIQRRHSTVEDARLLPLAERVLTPGDDALILAEYERLERHHLRAGSGSALEQAQSLVERVAERVMELHPDVIPAASGRAPCSPSSALQRGETRRLALQKR